MRTVAPAGRAERAESLQAMLILDAGGPGEVHTGGHGRDVGLQHQTHPGRRRERPRPRPPSAVELRPVRHNPFLTLHSSESCCKTMRKAALFMKRAFSVPCNHHLHFLSVRPWHILLSRVNTSPNDQRRCHILHHITPVLQPR